MAPSETTAKGRRRPYRPSFIDRVNRWVDGLAVRNWIFFSAFAAILILIQVLLLWLGGGLQLIELLPVIVFNGLYSPFLLGLFSLLDTQAKASLQTMRSILNMSEPAFEEARYTLSSMPPWPTLLAGLLMLAVVIIMEQVWVTPVRYASIERLSVFSAVFQIIDKSSAFLFGVFVYHTIRQLHLVNSINRRHVRISLYDQQPLQAFSRLTATTAVGLVVGVYVWLLINPDLLGDPLIFAFVGVSTVLAVSVFALPLYGVHRRMEEEKDKLLHAQDLKFEAIFAEFDKAFDSGHEDVLNRLNGTIASLEIQQNRIKAMATWPWKPETAQFTLTAITLPLILAVLQFLVERALD